MRYYIIAGEASGDLIGSNLIKELKQLDPAADIRCWGGDKMEAAGGKLVKHYRELAFMGYAEVIRNLPAIFKNIKFCKADIAAFKPDAVILVDYPGFNLRIVKWAKQQGLKTIYYISPTVWAWKENRVKLVKAYVDKMLVILPFEKEFYKKWNYEVDYVGHPLVKVIDDFRKLEDRSQASDFRPQTSDLRLQTSTDIVAVLPGSRKQEISKKLPIMLEVAKHFPEYQFVIAKAPGIEPAFYEGLITAYPNVSAVADQTYALLSQSKAAMVTSGTATLETALFEVPEVICYKGSTVSYQIVKRLVHVKYICLVNLIMDKAVVKELIQDELTVDNLVKELYLLLNDTAKQQQLHADYTALKELLSHGGNASANAAKSIYSFLTNAASV